MVVKVAELQSHILSLRLFDDVPRTALKMHQSVSLRMLQYMLL